MHVPQETLNPFVECTSGLIGGDGLSITLKLGLKRSIEHIRFSRTTVINTCRFLKLSPFDSRSAANQNMIAE